MRIFGAIKEEVRIRPATMQCPYLGPSLVELWYNGNQRFGRCFLAKEHSSSVFRASRLYKAGCPKPDKGLVFNGPNYCKFRDGDFVRVWQHRRASVTRCPASYQEIWHLSVLRKGVVFQWATTGYQGHPTKQIHMSLSEMTVLYVRAT